MVDDLEFDGATGSELRNVADGRDYIFVADTDALIGSNHPVLVIESSDDAGAGSDSVRSFRVTADHIASVENNLSIANLDFDDFVDSVDDRGIFRGFAAPAEPTTRTVQVSELLTTTEHVQLDSSVIERYRDALRAWGVSSVEVKDVDDLRATHDELESTKDNFRYSEEVVGLEETLEVTARGGRAWVFNIPIPRGWWAAYLDPQTLAPLALLMSRMPAPRQR